MAVGVRHVANTGNLSRFTLCGIYIEPDRWMFAEGTPSDEIADEARYGDGCRRCAKSLAKLEAERES